MTTLRVATYNVHHCLGVDGIRDLERTGATILETGADLVALQELDRGVRRSGGVDQPQRLQELTGMWIGFFPTIRFEGGEFGLGVAARHPLEVRFRALPRTRLDRPHGMILARLRGVGIVATHLSRRTVSRTVEMASLCWACRRLDEPKLLAGDLNAVGLAASMRRFAGLGEPASFRATFTSLHPRRQIDHIITSRGLRITDCRTIPSIASDHLPLVVEVEY